MKLERPEFNLFNALRSVFKNISIQIRFSGLCQHMERLLNFSNNMYHRNHSSQILIFLNSNLPRKMFRTLKGFCQVRHQNILTSLLCILYQQKRREYLVGISSVSIEMQGELSRDIFSKRYKYFSSIYQAQTVCETLKNKLKISHQFSSLPLQTYSERCQTSKMRRFAKTVNDFQPRTPSQTSDRGSECPYTVTRCFLKTTE